MALVNIKKGAGSKNRVLGLPHRFNCIKIDSTAAIELYLCLSLSQ
jgi:hypothetical protein